MARIIDPEGREAAALGRLGDFRGMDVLDVGCGDGRTTRHLARTAASVLAVDPDESRIEAARCDAGGVAKAIVFRVADAVTLELPPAGFDAIVFTRSL